MTFRYFGPPGLVYVILMSIMSNTDRMRPIIQFFFFPIHPNFQVPLHSTNRVSEKLDQQRRRQNKRRRNKANNESPEETAAQAREDGAEVDSDEADEDEKWSFASSFLYSLSLITTVGKSGQSYVT